MRDMTRTPIGQSPTPFRPPRRWWLIALIVFGVFCIMMLVSGGQTYYRAREAFAPESRWRLALSIVIDYAAGATISIVILWLVHRVPLSRNRAMKTFGFHAAAILVLSSMAFLVVIPAQAAVTGVSLSLADLPAMYREQAIYFLFGTIVTCVAVLAIGSAIDNADRLRERALYASRLESHLATARLKALSSQLQPHFLFNAHNAVLSLVQQRDNDKAAQMIIGLSELLRAALNNDGNPEIQLAEEIDFVERYLEIEQVRFGDRMAVEISIDPETADALVPKLILHPLVENAVRHGVAGTAHPCVVALTSRLHEDSLIIEITDRGTIPCTADSYGGAGVGLANTRARLEAIYMSDHEFTIEPLTGGGTRVRLVIPHSAHAARTEAISR